MIKILDIITRLKERNISIEDIEYATGYDKNFINGVVKSECDVDGLGDINSECYRIAAVYECLEYLSLRGYQVAEADHKSIYDVFAMKDNKLIKIQVRSGSKISKRGYPIFKVCRVLFNTKRIIKTPFKAGDFDYWYFYNYNYGSWIIPFDMITGKTELSMEKYTKYFIG